MGEKLSVIEGHLFYPTIFNPNQIIVSDSFFEINYRGHVYLLFFSLQTLMPSKNI
jgi:hypothetical protein